MGFVIGMAVVGKWCTGSGGLLLGFARRLAAAGGRCVPDDGASVLGFGSTMAVVGK